MIRSIHDAECFLIIIIVQCDLHDAAGCNVMLRCYNMASHMNEHSIAHISLLAAENQQLSKQLVEREDQDDLTQQPPSKYKNSETGSLSNHKTRM